MTLRKILSPPNLYKLITNPQTLKITHNRSKGSISFSFIEDYHQHQQDLQLKKDQIEYLKEYSYHNFNSNYKSWFELTHHEQFKFIDGYLRLHNEKSNMCSKVRNLGDLNKVITSKNTDIHFLFNYLYQELKEMADSETSQRKELEEDNVIIRESELHDLLFEKDFDL